MNMGTFKDVSQKLLERENEEEGATENTKLEGFQESCMRRHKGYFDEIAEALELTTDKLDRLKENGKWTFTEEGTEKLADALFSYEKETRGREKPEATKRLVKQIIKYGQYNAFAEVSVTEQLREYFAANEIIVICRDCFYKLFVDVGISEEEAKEIMHAADKKFSYSKRKTYQESFKWIGKFLKHLEKVNLDRHNDLSLSEKENTIWLDEINQKIEKDIDEAWMLRNRMIHIKKRERYKAIKESWINGGFIGILNNYNNENIEKAVLKECEENQDFMKDIKEYKKITKKDLDLETMVKLVGVNLVQVEEDDALLIIKECVGVPVDGNVLRHKGDDEKLEKILKNLYVDIKQRIINRGFDCLMTKDVPEKIKGEKLLEEAKKKIEIEM